MAKEQIICITQLQFDRDSNFIEGRNQMQQQGAKVQHTITATVELIYLNLIIRVTTVNDINLPGQNTFLCALETRGLNQNPCVLLQVNLANLLLPL